MILSVRLLLPLLLLGSPAAAQEELLPEKSGPVTRQTAVRDSPLLDFEYSWPQAIVSETKLVAQLNEDLSKSYDEALKEARETKTLVDETGGPFHQNMFNRVWKLGGQTPRLLSLESSTDTYTGGAHPMHNSAGLLWDRSGDRQVKLTELSAAPDGLEAAIRPEFCKRLDAERLKRRQGEVLEGDFSRCPELSEVTVIPVDSNGTGRFNSIRLIADPYVAGPYAEGSYEISVSVSDALVAALKPEFRSASEVQRPQ